MGSALGDAIGELAFRHPDRSVLTEVVRNRPELDYTDDTAMALGIAESLLEKGALDQQHLGETFRRNFEREPWRGYASGPPTIFSRVRSTGITYVEAARSLFQGAGSLGNGAAMRVVPVGLFFHDAADIYDKAAASAEVTHAHSVGMDGAAVQAKAIAMAIGLNPALKLSRQTFVNELIDFAQSREIKSKMRLVSLLLEENERPQRVADRLGRTVLMHESMPFAVYSFLKFPKSFEECLFCATLNGGDRDTLGAMACAVSGAYLGIDAIPNKWVERLENRETIEHLAISLAKEAKGY